MKDSKYTIRKFTNITICKFISIYKKERKSIPTKKNVTTSTKRKYMRNIYSDCEQRINMKVVSSIYIAERDIYAK